MKYTIPKANGKIIKENGLIRRNSWDAGDGLKFDGVDDFVDTSFSPDFNITNQWAISIVLSVSDFNAQGSAVRQIMSSVTGSNNTGFLILAAENKIRLFLVGNNIVTSAVWAGFDFLSVNTKYHVIFNKGAGYDLKAYKDNEVYSENVIGSPTSVVNTNLHIGKKRFDNTGRFAGTIYDIKTFDRQLTLAEIRKLQNTENNLIPSSAISNVTADWRFSQRQGTTLKDFTANAYNGTLTNFANTTPSAGNAWVDKYGNSITKL